MNKLLCKWVLVGLSGVLTVSCAGDGTNIPDMPVEQLYMRGYDDFKEKDYEMSAHYFDEVERQHPYSVWAPRAQIMAAYAYYTANNYDDAILTLDRFIQLHPGNRNIAYAYYLKGLCYFEQMSDVSREQKMTEDALSTFKEVLARFPNSIYVPDINVKLKEIEAHLAGKEMAVGRYYLKHNEFIPAMNRFQTVLLEHPQTNQTPEALYRLTVCYESLGMHKQATAMAWILQKYYAKDEWTKKAIKLVNKYERQNQKEIAETQKEKREQSVNSVQVMDETTEAKSDSLNEENTSVETGKSDKSDKVVSDKKVIVEPKKTESKQVEQTDKKWTDYIWPF